MIKEVIKRIPIELFMGIGWLIVAIMSDNEVDKNCSLILCFMALFTAKILSEIRIKNICEQ